MTKLKKTLFEEFDKASSDYQRYQRNQEEVDKINSISTKVTTLYTLIRDAGLVTSYIKWKAKRKFLKNNFNSAHQ